MAEGRDKGYQIASNLNDLPDDILLHILTFLPTTFDAVRTSLVSRRWRKIWFLLSSLKFLQLRYPPKSSDRETTQSFIHFVLHTLGNRRLPVPVTELHLQTEYDGKWDEHSSSIELILIYALEFNVSVVKLDFCREIIKRKVMDPNTYLYSDHLYDSPWFYLELFWVSKSNVRTLELCECEVDFSADLLEMTQFSSLQSLSLKRVYLLDDVLSVILTACVNLESLSISHVPYEAGTEELNIRSLTLKSLELKHTSSLISALYTIKISAPNLVSLTMIQFELDEYIFEDVSSLVGARIICRYYSSWSLILRYLAHVECLRTHNCWFELLLLKDDDDVPIPENYALNNLRKLELLTGYTKTEVLGLAALFERCPNLETLSLSSLTQWHEEENIPEDLSKKPLDVRLPYVKEVVIESYYGTEEESQMIDLLKEQGKNVIVNLPKFKRTCPVTRHKSSKILHLLDLDLFSGEYVDPDDLPE